MSVEETSETSPGEAGDGDKSSNARRILDAAEKCFSLFGYQKTSMEDIAREAGLSRRSVYRHFPDKAALHLEVVTSRTAVYLEEVRERTSRIEGLSAQIEEVARIMIRLIREDPISVAMQRVDPDSLARTVTSESRELLMMAMETIVPLIEKARDNGETRADLDIRRAAEWIARVVISLAATPSISFDISDPEQTAAFLREFLVPGLR